MEAKSSEARTKARIQIVEEHIRLENLHGLDGFLATFGPSSRLLTAINHPLTIAGAFFRKMIGH